MNWLSLNKVIASEKISVDRTTGDVSFNKSDANELEIKVSTGNVKGTLLTSKIFIVELNITGREKLKLRYLNEIKTNNIIKGKYIKYELSFFR